MSDSSTSADDPHGLDPDDRSSHEDTVFDLDDEARRASLDPEGALFDDGVESDVDEAPVFTATAVKAKVDAARAESHDKYLRLLAEYDNFRRRTERERAQLAADALGDFVKDLLPVFDSLDKACALADDGAAGVADGLALIRRQLEAALPKHDVATHQPKGEPFDPRVHEALTQQPSAEHAPGTVLEVFEKGYSIGGRLLRPARVVVAAKP